MSIRRGDFVKRALSVVTREYAQSSSQSLFESAGGCPSASVQTIVLRRLFLSGLLDRDLAGGRVRCPRRSPGPLVVAVVVVVVVSNNSSSSSSK